MRLHENVKVSVGATRVHCDYCGHNIDNVPYAELGEFVNKPCPVCGEDLLTEQDYLSAMVLIAVINGGDITPSEKISYWAENVEAGKHWAKFNDPDQGTIFEVRF